MPAATLTVGNVEISAILDVDTSKPLAEVFDGSGDPPPGGSESLAARYPEEFTADAWRFRDHCFPGPHADAPDLDRHGRRPGRLGLRTMARRRWDAAERS
jgi:hypothetical protein